MLMFQNHVMDEMCDQAKEEYPLECCGVLLGKREKNMRIVFEIIPIQNTAEPDERKTHFFIQPFEFLRIEKTAVEKELESYIAEEDRPVAHHWLILHGRYVCTARKPRCSECGLSEWCTEYLSGGECGKHSSGKTTKTKK